MGGELPAVPQMSRPPRQIDDQADVLADVLADPAAHRPHRPHWICACGQPWPCEPLRGHMVATMSAQDIGVAMDPYYRFAVIELAAPAEDVHQRLFGWIRAAR